MKRNDIKQKEMNLFFGIVSGTKDGGSYKELTRERERAYQHECLCFLLQWPFHNHQTCPYCILEGMRGNRSLQYQDLPEYIQEVLSELFFQVQSTSKYIIIKDDPRDIP